MTFNRCCIVIGIALILIVSTLTGCQQLSKIIKPKSSSTSSTASTTKNGGNISITDCKYVSTWVIVLYGKSDSRLFTMLNVPISFNGLSFSGGSSNVFDYCNSHGAGNDPDCVKSYECAINGTVAQDKKKLEKVSCSIKVIIDDESSVSGKYEVSGIPFEREEDFRSNKDSGNYHSYYELRGNTVGSHVTALDMVGYNKKGYSAVKMGECRWEGNAGFEYVFKLLNSDVN